MVYLPDEGEAMAAAGPAMYINVGTLLPIYDETLPRTAARLAELGKPWVLDPVAVGIGEMRTRLLAGFKEQKPTIIRGNASEVIALAALWGLEGARQPEPGARRRLHAGGRRGGGLPPWRSRATRAAPSPFPARSTS